MGGFDAADDDRAGVWGGLRIGWSSSLKSITDVPMLSPPGDSDLDLGGVMLGDAEGLRRGNFAFAVGEIGKSNNSEESRVTPPRLLSNTGLPGVLFVTAPCSNAAIRVRSEVAGGIIE